MYVSRIPVSKNPRRSEVAEVVHAIEVLFHVTDLPTFVLNSLGWYVDATIRTRGSGGGGGDWVRAKRDQK
jgi:hypothetical protein